MAVITHRVGLGRNLTAAEVDANFDGLNEELATKAGTAAVTASTAGLAPAGGGNANEFLNGQGVYATPAGAGDMLLDGVQTVTGQKTFGAGALVATSPQITSPTGLVKADVGLENVDNTADLAKPVSSAAAAALADKAPLASPALTGTPTAPTAAAATNTTQLATTAHVFAERTNTATLTNKTISGASNTLSNIAQSSVTSLTADLAAKAPLASPALTGTPTAPTAAAATNTTQVATTAHVFAERSNTATLTNKTINGSSNTLTNIAQSSITDLEASLAALSSAIDLKVDLLGEVILGSGTTAITHNAHANRSCIVNQAGATTGTFAATATSGALAGDSFYLRNTGAGTFTASGAITAPTGYKLTCSPNESFSADYDSVDDAWYSTTPATAVTTVTTTAYKPSSGMPATLGSGTAGNTKAAAIKILAGDVPDGGQVMVTAVWTHDLTGTPESITVRIRVGGVGATYSGMGVHSIMSMSATQTIGVAKVVLTRVGNDIVSAQATNGSETGGFTTTQTTTGVNPGSTDWEIAAGNSTTTFTTDAGVTLRSFTAVIIDAASNA
jgi:hypothetical protein